MALNDATLSSLLLQLYGCALRPEAWPELLARLATVLDAPQAALVHHQAVDGVFVAAPLSYGVDPEGMHKYNAYYGSRDPWTVRHSQRGGFAPGTVGVTTSEALIPESELRKTEFHADFGRRYGMVHNVMLVAVPEAADSTTCLTLPSGDGRPAHTPALLEALSILAPHLQQALRLSLTLRQSERHNQELTAVLEHADDASALLGAGGAVRFMNGAMRRLLVPGSPLTVVRRQLRPSSLRARRAFARALSGMAHWRDGRLAPVSATIPLDEGPVPGRLLTLTPIPSADDPATCLIVARVIDQAVAAERRTAARLQAVGLTPTEARIATLLAAGRDVRDIAAVVHAQESTVRWHLKQVFAKTGTRTQAQLVVFVLAT